MLLQFKDKSTSDILKEVLCRSKEMISNLVKSHDVQKKMNDDLTLKIDELLPLKAEVAVLREKVHNAESMPTGKELSKLREQCEKIGNMVSNLNTRVVGLENRNKIVEQEQSKQRQDIAKNEVKKKLTSAAKRMKAAKKHGNATIEKELVRETFSIYFVRYFDTCSSHKSVKNILQNRMRKTPKTKRMRYVIKWYIQRKYLSQH